MPRMDANVLNAFKFWPCVVTTPFARPLEKLGFVERVHAAEDRRKIMVRITSSGSEIVSTMREHIASELANIMEDLDDVDASSVAAANQAIEGKNLES